MDRKESDMTEQLSTGGCDGAQSMAVRSYPTSEARGGSQEKQPHVQGVVTAYEQEGLEELFHVQGQEGRP